LWTEKVHFFRKFLKSPGKVGSFIPSSSFLVDKMLEYIEWNRICSIIELGAGTGVLTRKLAKLKQSHWKVLVFELDNEMRQRLEQLIPEFNYYVNAKEIYHIVQLQGLEKVDCIISGLPFANFSEELREDILDGVVRSLKPEGQFVAFQYSLHMKEQLHRYFATVKISFVPLNLPPAFIYHCHTPVAQHNSFKEVV